jgi:hypothetical protein
MGGPLSTSLVAHYIIKASEQGYNLFEKRQRMQRLLDEDSTDVNGGGDDGAVESSSSPLMMRIPPP